VPLGLKDRFMVRKYFFLLNKLLRRKKRITTLVLHFVIFGVFSFIVPQQTFAQQEGILETRAKEIVSAKYNIQIDTLKIVGSTIGHYQYSGKASHNFKVIDSNENGYEVHLSESGQELAEDALSQENLAVKLKKYGKLDPDLAQKLSNTPHYKALRVIITIQSPRIESPVTRPNMSKEELIEIRKDFSQRSNASAQSATQLVVTKLQSLGYHAKNIGNGFITTELPPNVIKEVEQWDEVSAISDGSKKSYPLFTNNELLNPYLATIILTGLAILIPTLIIRSKKKGRKAFSKLILFSLAFLILILVSTVILYILNYFSLFHFNATMQSGFAQ
jgi:hypothetical protein